MWHRTRRDCLNEKSPNKLFPDESIASSREAWAVGADAPNGFQCQLLRSGAASPPPLYNWTSCSSPRTAANLSDGAYSFSVRAAGGYSAQQRRDGELPNRKTRMCILEGFWMHGLLKRNVSSCWTLCHHLAHHHIERLMASFLL